MFLHQPLVACLLTGAPTLATTPVPADGSREVGVTHSLFAPLDSTARDSAGQDNYGRTYPTTPIWYWAAGFSWVTTVDSDGPGEEINFDEGWGVHLAFGRRFHGDTDEALAWDVELEGLFTDQDAEREGVLRPITDITVTAVMLNALAAIPVAEQWELFGGGGLGLAFMDVGTRSDSFNTFDEEDGPFLSWQLRAGARYGFSDTTSVEVGYRFLNIDDNTIDDDLGGAGFELETEQHSLGLSLRFGA